MSPSPAVVCDQSCQVPAEPEHRYCSEEIGRNGVPRQVALKHMSMPEMRKNFCIPDFLEVSIYKGGDELTIDMISEFPYSSTKLLIAAGQLEAGLRLPLYDAENPFQYEALANWIPQRGVVQYTGNFYRMLRECILRSKGKTSLPGGSNPSFDSNNYTAENFNITFVEVSKKMHHSWSVGPHRNPAKNDKRVRLLNDADNTKITKFLRWDNDHRWYSTPLVISGPWVLGHMPDGSARTCTDKEYPAYSPWELNLTFVPYKTDSSLSEKKKRRQVKLIGKTNGEKRSGGHEKKRRRVENVNKNNNKQKSRVSEVKSATNGAGSPTVVEARPALEMDAAVKESHQPQMISTPAADNFVEVPSSDDSELEEPMVVIKPEQRLLNQVQREDRHALLQLKQMTAHLADENASLRAKYDQEVDALQKQLDEMRRRAEKVSADQQADRAAAQTDRTTLIEKLAAANAKIESRELQLHNMESDLNKAEDIIQKKDIEIDALRNRIQGLEDCLENADLTRKHEEKLRLLATKQKEGYMKNVEAQKLTIRNLEIELVKKEKSNLELRTELQDSEQARSRAETQVAELRKEHEDSERKIRKSLEECIKKLS